MSFSQEITSNVESLEARARTLEQQEIDRSRAIDQKTAGLMAVCLVVLGAGVAFASRIGDLDAGSGARTYRAVVLIAAMVLVLVALALATIAIRPQAIHTAIHIDELDAWGNPRMLERDPVEVRGELVMPASTHPRSAPGQQAQGRSVAGRLPLLCGRPAS